MIQALVNIICTTKQIQAPEQKLVLSQDKDWLAKNLNGCQDQVVTTLGSRIYPTHLDSAQAKDKKWALRIMTPRDLGTTQCLAQ